MLFSQLDLVISRDVHEGILPVGFVKELHFVGIEAGGRHFLIGIESALDDCAGLDVFNFRADECRAFTGLDVLELDDLPRRPVNLNR